VTPREQNQEQLVHHVAVGDVEVVLERGEVDPSIHILLNVLEGVLPYLTDKLCSHGVVYKVAVGAKDIAASTGGGRALLIRVAICALLLGL